MDEMVREEPAVEAPQVQMALVVDALIRALGTKALMFAALVMTFALFCWAMWLQSAIGFGIAAAFGLAVLLPVLYIGMKEARDG